MYDLFRVFSAIECTYAHSGIAPAAAVHDRQQVLAGGHQIVGSPMPGEVGNLFAHEATASVECRAPDAVGWLVRHTGAHEEDGLSRTYSGFRGMR
jgi:hypothetical protein